MQSKGTVRGNACSVYVAGNASNEVASVVSTGVIPDEPVVTQTYDADGRLVSRDINDANRPTPHVSQTPTEDLHWSYANRLLALETDYNSLVPACPPPSQPYPQTYRADGLEWTYRYSPSGLREQKRLMRAPTHDSAQCEGVFPWTYYVRSPSGSELVVYQGRQVAHVGAPVGCQGPGYGKIVNNVTQRLVYLYPVEYRSYCPHGVQLMWVRDPNTGAMTKKFVETDERGSIAGLHDAADIQTDYHPFGYPIDVNGNYDVNWTNRTGWLDRETDYESGVGNLTLSYLDVNARKYVPQHARFITPDEMWNLNILGDPYAYAMHDPVNLADPSGYKNQITTSLSGDSFDEDYGKDILRIINIRSVVIFSHSEGTSLGYLIWINSEILSSALYPSGGNGGGGSGGGGSGSGGGGGGGKSAKPEAELILTLPYKKGKSDNRVVGHIAIAIGEDVFYSTPIAGLNDIIPGERDDYVDYESSDFGTRTMTLKNVDVEKMKSRINELQEDQKLPYSLTANSCITFVAEVLRAGGMEITLGSVGEYVEPESLFFAVARSKYGSRHVDNVPKGWDWYYIARDRRFQLWNQGKLPPRVIPDVR
jgi:RHS repeat-associated protein